MSDNEDTVGKWMMIMAGVVFLALAVGMTVEKCVNAWRDVRVAEARASTQPATQPSGERP